MFPKSFLQSWKHWRRNTSACRKVLNFNCSLLGNVQTEISPTTTKTPKTRHPFSHDYIIHNSDLIAPHQTDRQTGSESCSENNRPSPDMSDGVEKTKHVRWENNASFHQVQLHGRDIKLRQRGEWSSSSFGMDFLLFLFSYYYYFFPSLTGWESPLPIATIWMKIWGRL